MKQLGPATPARVAAIMRTLAKAIDGLELPAVEKISTSQEEDPFQVLIATLLSARTQDATTLTASTRLFQVARTPQAMAKLTVKQIERLKAPLMVDLANPLEAPLAAPHPERLAPYAEHLRELALAV